jgi:hypothetical protein
MFCTSVHESGFLLAIALSVLRFTPCKRCTHFLLYNLSQVVNFIILNPFIVVKWKSCFILLRGILILSFLSNVLYICSWVRFSFGYCIVCPSIYTILLPLWYLQTFLIICCFFSFKLVCLLDWATRKGWLWWGRQFLNHYW